MFRFWAILLIQRLESQGMIDTEIFSRDVALPCRSYLGKFLSLSFMIMKMVSRLNFFPYQIQSLKTVFFPSTMIYTRSPRPSQWVWT